MENVVGLFGTYVSKWREEIAIPMLTRAEVRFHNPIVAVWDEQAMANDVFHAKNDRVLMVVVTGESTGFGSLAESGWIAFQSYLRGQKTILVLEDIPKDVCPERDESGGPIAPNKNRELLRQHIRSLPEDVLNKHIFLCPDVVEATKLAIQLMRE